MMQFQSVHVQTNNMTALPYVLKIGWTQSLILVNLSKKISYFLLLHQITITAEYLPGILNVTADWKPRHVKGMSEWKLNHQAFKMICQAIGLPEIDLFASRHSDQNQTHFSWKPDPHCLAVDTLQQRWNQKIAFMHFLHLH